MDGRGKRFRDWNALEGRQEIVSPETVLPEDDLVFFLLDTIPQLDLSAFYQYYSTDGRGRALDNVFIERLWRSLKYEDIYLKNYEGVDDLYGGLEDYFHFYNQERRHQALDYRTPYEVYQASLELST